MTIEDIKNRLKSKLERIEKCETQFHIGQKQQIADVLAMISLLDQPTVINLSHKSFEIRNMAKTMKATEFDLWFNNICDNL